MKYQSINGTDAGSSYTSFALIIKIKKNPIQKDYKIKEMLSDTLSGKKSWKVQFIVYINFICKNPNIEILYSNREY